MSNTTTKPRPADPKIAPPPPAPSFPISTDVVRGPAPAIRPTRSLAGRKVGEIAKLTVPVERDYLLLDRSGSMAVQWREALDAINAYAGTLGSKINTRIWMAVFDNAFDVLRNDIFPAAWRPITDEEVQPRGSTALDD